MEFGPSEPKALGEPKFVVDSAGEEVGAFVLGAGAEVGEELPDSGPESFRVIAERARVAVAAAFEPFGPGGLGEVFAGEAELVDDQLFDRDFEVVEALLEAVADDGFGVVQDRVAHQPGLEAEVEVFDAPAEHLGIEAAQVVVQLAMDREGTTDQGGAFIEQATAMRMRAE